MNDSSQAPFDAAELEQIYRLRFAASQAYRNRVWRVLTAEFFARYIRADDTVLDLGCGYGEFINHIRCRSKFAMDLNPSALDHLNKEVTFLRQSCSSPWSLPDASLDAVFTSNFFEHLPDKKALSLTFEQARRCLKSGGRILCLGPNVKFLPGKYWDFWDHHLPLTEMSLREGLETHGFEITTCYAKFLPYTMVNTRPYPLWMIRLYLRLPFAWRIFGRQFLVIARKAIGNDGENRSATAT